MISEVSFSRGYTSFWIEYTPWLNDYITSINKYFVNSLYTPIEVQEDPSFRSINNVIAFTLFKNIIKFNDNNLSKSFNEASAILKNFPRNNLEDYSSDALQNEIINIQTKRLIENYKGKDILFSPQFNGCGILESCSGDIFYNDTLVEIKAGERMFTPSDLKQLIIYCALNGLSNSKIKIINIELFNPRQGLCWKSSLNDVIFSISDLPIDDLFNQIGKFLINLSEEVELT